eukprot:scaffold139228_cov59-Cyclotella_meneghiniana.AAC.8
MEEIFSEVGETTEDGGLAKILAYDIVRQCRRTAAIASVDAANCYDSIAHAIASLIFQASFGDSSDFKSSKVEAKFQGLCQGNGAAPAGWAAISVTIVNAHKKRGHSAVFMCLITRKITNH